MLFELQVVTVPLHAELQEQPYSLLHELESLCELHGVMVPEQLQVHPLWELHVDCVLSEEHAVSVPVHGTDQPQPALLQRALDW